MIEFLKLSNTYERKKQNDFFSGQLIESKQNQNSCFASSTDSCDNVFIYFFFQYLMYAWTQSFCYKHLNLHCNKQLFHLTKLFLCILF